MKKTLYISVIAAGLALAGCNKSTRTSTASNDATVPADPNATVATSTDTTMTTAGSRIDAAADRTANSMANAANSASSAVSSAANSAGTQMRIVEWKLASGDIQADLNNDRPIVRTKDPIAAGAPTGTMDASVLETSIQGKLAADSELAALKLEADAQKGGEVTLDGKAASATQVGKAIALALDTEGVVKVTSKIKLDKDAKITR